jgi:hypothetical protein
MGTVVTCEILIAMNEDGDYVVVTEESEALSKLAEYCGGYHARVVKLNVTMTPPAMTVANIAVPDADTEQPEITVGN